MRAEGILQYFPNGQKKKTPQWIALCHGVQNPKENVGWGNDLTVIKRFQTQTVAKFKHFKVGEEMLKGWYYQCTRQQW